MSASNPSEIAGIFAIDKPPGWTSHDVVARVRRLARLKRVGHAGTLDPAAVGVLPVCLGQATRLVEYLSATGKEYRATITFGVATTTYDAEGEVVATMPLPPDLDEAAIAAILPRFQGVIMQVPPLYSALKRDGQRLYDLARAGAQIEIAPRPVRIDALTIIAWQPPTLVLDVACGKGTYIRSLAHDLGAAFGCGAHLAALIRMRVGPFTRAHSITLDDLAAAFADDTWRDHLYAPDEAVLDLPAVILGPANEQRVRNGQAVSPPHLGDHMEDQADNKGDQGDHKGTPLQTSGDGGRENVRAYTADGRFLAILAAHGPGQWQPEKVFDVTPVE